MTQDIETNGQTAVETVSATANLDACAAPREDTLRDLSPPAAAVSATRAYAENAGEASIPTADLLLRGDESGFVSALAVLIVPGEWRDKRRIVAVARPFGFVTKLGRTRIAIIVPARFETDFASIPVFARWLISPFGRHAEAAVIHDWLYALGPVGDRKARRRADRIFAMTLKEVGIGFILRTIMFCAVRIGGSGAFGGTDQLKFRTLSTLTPVQPQPEREPFLRTVATA